MNVKLSPLAAEQLDALLDYLENEWSHRVKMHFLVKLDRSVQAISRLPHAHPVSEKMPGLRKCVITPQTSAYYRIVEDSVEIATFLDNRMDF